MRDDFDIYYIVENIEKTLDERNLFENYHLLIIVQYLKQHNEFLCNKLVAQTEIIDQSIGMSTVYLWLLGQYLSSRYRCIIGPAETGSEFYVVTVFPDDVIISGKKRRGFAHPKTNDPVGVCLTPILPHERLYIV